MLGNQILYVAGPYACSYICRGDWDWCLNVVGVLIQSVISSNGKASLRGPDLCLCRAVNATQQGTEGLHLQQVFQILMPQSAQETHIQLPEQLHLALAPRIAG